MDVSEGGVVDGQALCPAAWKAAGAPALPAQPCCASRLWPGSLAGTVLPHQCLPLRMQRQGTRETEEGIDVPWWETSSNPSSLGGGVGVWSAAGVSWACCWSEGGCQHP